MAIITTWTKIIPLNVSIVQRIAGQDKVFIQRYFLVVQYVTFFYAASTPVLRAGYGLGNDPIVLDDLRCNGRENRLIDCPKRAIGTHNCFHSKDAGVICAPLFIPGPGMLEC